MICIRLVILVLVNISLSLSMGNVTSNDDRTKDWALELVAVVFRHGIRAPDTTWPTDPYRDEKLYWPAGWEQLLPKGKQQMFRLGKSLRNRYKSLISKYSPLAVRVNSSDHDRCLMSAASLAAGWFPPQPGQNWPKDLDWQPVPINALPAYKDTVIAQQVCCPKYSFETAKVQQEEASNQTAEDRLVLEYCAKHIGEPVTRIQQLGPVYQTLTIEDKTGHKLPAWTKLVYPEKIFKILSQDFKTFSWTKYQQRITAGPLLKEILNQFKLKSEGQSHRNKVFIYSGHDTNVYNIFRALKFEDPALPDFGATLLFELHKSPDDIYFVKLLYMNNTEATRPLQMNIPQCPNPCSLTRLYRMTEYLRAVNWDEDCKLDA